MNSFISVIKHNYSRFTPVWLSKNTLILEKLLSQFYSYHPLRVIYSLNIHGRNEYIVIYNLTPAE